MATGVVLKGQDRLQRRIAQMSNAPKVFDPVFGKGSRQSLRRLIQKTPKDTGSTARGWTTPKKVGLSNYLVENRVVTQDKKHAIVNILDQGHGVITPKRANKLYIPLSNKGKSKKLGEKIPKGLVYGVDYVLVDKVGPVKGTKFKTKELLTAGKDLTRGIIRKIRSVHRG